MEPGKNIVEIDNLNKNGLTVIMVTHDKEAAEKVSDHLMYLKDGKIIDNKQLQS